jgi:hypothetical protein
MLAAESVEYREAHPHERNPKALRRLSSMRMRDEKISADGKFFEIAKITDLERFGRHFREYF